jgi:arylsulfatase A-like enzyme
VTPPNILYIHSHDTGRYVQPYGYGVPTPRIQRLAEEGMLFRNSFCAASTCSASRACLLTGQYAHTNGMMGLAHRGWSLNDYGHHIVHVLRDRGYHSALIGEQHISKRPDIIGYDEVVKIPTSRVDDVAPVAVDLLRDPPGRPFFMSVGFFETHREFFDPKPYDEPYVRPPLTLPDRPEIRRDWAGFVESARKLDHGVGVVLDALERHGHADNTLVICTTDHGVPFPGAKATMTDSGLGVMLIMRGPGGLTGGRVTDSLVSHIDLFPTICDLAGVETPPWVQGTSLMPLVRGEVDSVRDHVFAEGTYHSAYEPQRAIRSRKWKYVRRFDRRDRPVLPNIDDSPSKDLWIAHGWPPWLLEQEQLYDLTLDPSETNNQIGRQALEPVAAELRERLQAWMEQTDDPLLHGPVPPPPGAEYNHPDQRSATDPVVVAPGGPPGDGAANDDGAAARSERVPGGKHGAR